MPVSQIDPACDQCRLKKIRCGREQPECLNCQRSCVPCGFSARGKRSSQSRLVIDHLEEIKSRLNSVDKTIFQLQSAIGDVMLKPQQLDKDIPSVSMVKLGDASRSEMSESRDQQPAFAKHRHLINEQYYGPSSLVACLGEIKLLLADRVKKAEENNTNQGPFSQEEDLEALFSIMKSITSFSIEDDPLDLSSDGIPLALPPKGLLDALIEPYFNQANWLFPVFRKEVFGKSVREAYEVGPAKTDSAWVVCFNNLIVQTLKARTLGSSSQLSSEDGASHNMYNDAMEVELLRPFLVNSRRGLEKLERFLEPRLVNVQALISMCVIAQENFEHRLSLLLLHQACFVAKSMGLHQQNSMLRSQTPDEALEYQYVFWALYLIDKTITGATGNCCCLSLVDCDVTFPERDPNYPFLEHLIARIELAVVQEDCYLNLYSSQACRRSDMERNSSIVDLDHKLEQWASKYPDFCEDCHEESNGVLSGQSHINTALSYCFHSIRILVYRPSNSSSHRTPRQEDARICVRLFARLSRESTMIANAVMLRQTVQDHAVVPFLILFANVVQDPQADDSVQDLQLMLLVFENLQHDQRFDRKSSYASKLLLLVSSCCQIATAIINNTNLSMLSRNASSVESDTTSRRGEIDNTVHTQWTSVGQYPVPDRQLDQVSDFQSWNFNFNHLIDSGMALGGQEMSCATPGLGVTHMEQMSVNGFDIG